MKDRQTQHPTQIEEKTQRTTPNKQSSLLPVQTLQALLVSRGSLSALPISVLETLSELMGNANLLALLQNSGITPPATIPLNVLPPEQWDTENPVETPMPDLYPIEPWPAEIALSPSPLDGITERR